MTGAEEPHVPLPEPDGGWRRLRIQLAAVALSAGVAAWAATALVLRNMEAHCWSNGAGTTICDPNPSDEVVHRFDAVWPRLGDDQLLVPAVAFFMLPMLAAIGCMVFLATSEPWSEIDGAPSSLEAWCAIGGAGLGLVVAGPGFERWWVAAAITGAGAVACLSARAGGRHFARRLRAAHVLHRRRLWLLEHGRRTQGRVLDVGWRQRWHHDGPVFTPTVAYDGPHGPRQATATLQADVSCAPTVGGGVLVFVDDDPPADAPFDVVLATDPAGPHESDPEVLRRYEAPDGW